MGKAHYDQLCRENEIVSDFTRLDIQAYPIEHEIIEEMLSCCDIIYVFEEDYPYIEDQFLFPERDIQKYMEEEIEQFQSQGK